MSNEQVGQDKDRPEDRQPDYEPPRLDDIGTVSDVTQALSGPLIGITGQNPSDRNMKDHFESVDSREILARVTALPVTTWSYRSDPQSVRHIGPMAQDFATAFAVGADDRQIHVVDASGVALAAIQGLSALLEEQRGEIDRLRFEVERLGETIGARDRWELALSGA